MRAALNGDGGIVMGYKGKVLVVDDDEDLLDMVCFSLSRAGYDVEKAGDGLKAVELAGGRGLDAVLLDIMLPELDGVSVLREIKKRAPGVEVVMMTAHGSIDTAVESMRLGAFDYIKKPFDLAALEAVVDKAVEKRLFCGVAVSAFAAAGPDGLMDSLAASAARLVGAGEVLICELPKKGVAGVLPECEGAYGAERGGARYGLCEAGMRRLEETGCGAFAAEAGAGGWLAGIPGAAGLGSALFLPLTDDGRVTGVLYAGRAPGDGQFGEGELQRARHFGPLVSLAAKNHALNKKLHEVRMQLAQSQKLEAVGMLTGQISHDFNNLLAVIIGSVQLIMENPGPGAAMRLSGEILRMAREAEALVKQLMLFVRRGEETPAPSDLNAAIEDIKFIISKLAGNGVKMEYSLAAGLPRVTISPEHFKQVIINLAANARNAMPGGGRVFVSTRRAGPGDAVPGGAGGCGFVVVEVADEGEGIAPENLEKIFEPFFTTGPAGKGTGFGLYTVQGVVKERGGTISAANRPGGGAVFQIILPAAPA